MGYWSQVISEQCVDFGHLADDGHACSFGANEAVDEGSYFLVRVPAST